MRLREMCLRFRLLPTGGSDFHGSNKPDISIGSGRGGLRISRLLLDDIKDVYKRQVLYGYVPIFHQLDKQLCKRGIKLPAGLFAKLLAGVFDRIRRFIASYRGNRVKGIRDGCLLYTSSPETEDSGGGFLGTGYGPFRALIVSNFK